MEDYGRFQMMNSSTAECHLINVKAQQRESEAPPVGAAQSQVCYLQRLVEGWGGVCVGGVKWARLCRGNDGDPCKEAVPAWEVPNNTIHHGNTIVPTPPSGGAIITSGCTQIPPWIKERWRGRLRRDVR